MDEKLSPLHLGKMEIQKLEEREDKEMSFSDVKKEIFEAAVASKKSTFSERAFNQLTSAMVNEMGYQATIATSKKGDETENIEPVKEFRKSVIGGIAKSAGADDAEVNEMINNYKFSPNTPWYPIVSEAITNSMEAGKAFTMLPKADMNCTLKIEEKAEQVKMVGKPGTPENEKKPVLYGKFRKIVSTSTCPDSLKKTQ